MTLLWILPGIALPTLSGWLLLGLLEARAPVLYRTERWVLGFLLGLTLTMFLTFLASIANLIDLTRLGFFLVQMITTLVCGVCWWKRCGGEVGGRRPRADTRGTRLAAWLKVLLAAALLWTAVKVVLAGSTFLFLTPATFDDVVNNWNFRGKVFFVTQELRLELPDATGTYRAGGVNSYPPAVPLAKAWLATLPNAWDEALINSVNFLWFLAAIALVFFALRRVVSLPWAIAGVYIMTSLPLELMHGTNPYADAFLSAHVFAAVYLLFSAARAPSGEERNSFLKLSAFAAALLPFTKNEALLLHLPAFLLVFAGYLWFLRWRDGAARREVYTAILTVAIPLLAVLIPWLVFKWTHGLDFGNAKSLTAMELGWQPGVLTSIWINTFFEGNWLLLFPLVIGLLLWQRRTAFRSPLLICTAFFLLVYLGQFPLYLFTPLSTEALRQTGYARGIIQLVPVIVFAVTVLLAQGVAQERRARSG